MKTANVEDLTKLQLGQIINVQTGLIQEKDKEVEVLKKAAEENLKSYYRLQKQLSGRDERLSDAEPLMIRCDGQTLPCSICEYKNKWGNNG